MRISKKLLTNKFKWAGEAMGWDIAGDIWAGGKSRVGATFLQHKTHYGWAVAQIVNEGGAETNLRGSCSSAEMLAWLEGILFAKEGLRS